MKNPEQNFIVTLDCICLNIFWLFWFYINLLLHFVSVQLFVDYTAETYSKFMQGDDTFEDEDETFLIKLSKQDVPLWSKSFYMLVAQCEDICFNFILAILWENSDQNWYLELKCVCACVCVFSQRGCTTLMKLCWPRWRRSTKYWVMRLNDWRRRTRRSEDFWIDTSTCVQIRLLIWILDIFIPICYIQGYQFIQTTD